MRLDQALRDQSCIVYLMAAQADGRDRKISREDGASLREA